MVQAAESKENTTLYSFIRGLVIEADDCRDTATWDTNLEFYLGNQWRTAAPKGLKQFVDNRTQNAIIASAAVQTEQRPRIRLEPAETDEPPVYFLLESGTAKLAQLVQDGQNLLGFTMPQIGGVDQISEQQAQQLASMQVPQIDENTGMVAALPVFDENDIIAVTDQVAAEADQTVMEYFWERSHADYLWTQNIINKGVVGHQPLLNEWDDQKNIPELSNLHPCNVWIDPTADGIEDAEYCIIVEVMSAERAKSLYPEHAHEIEKRKSSGKFTLGDGMVDEGRVGSPYSDTDFHRDMVGIYTAWLRNRPFKKTPQEAGLQPAVDETGLPIEGTFLNGEGGITSPDNEDWPIRYGIRQVTLIDDIILDDRESPFSDIPVSWNVNIPIPFRPYGQGEPERVKDLQEAINRVISILHNYCKYYQSPQEYWPQSLLNQVKNLGKSHSHPGRRIPVPDHLWEQYIQNRKQGFAQDPPTMPVLFMDFLNFLVNEHDTVSGNSSVLQGSTDSSAESGRAIMALQQAARGSIGFKSLYTERAIRHSVRMWLQFLRDFLPESEWMKIVGGMPVQVLRSMRNRGKNIEYDVRVEIVSGKGTNRQIEQDRAVFQYDRGLRTQLSTMQALDIPDAKKQHAELQAQALAAQQAESQSSSSGERSSGGEDNPS